MRRGKILDRVWILDHPHRFRVVRHKHSSLRLPLRMSHGDAASPAFLHAIRSARLRVLRPASLVANPPRP
jgi:hypothetical protein